VNGSKTEDDPRVTPDAQFFGPPLLTPRLELRAPTEDDRSRFVELFCDDSFMVFAGGSLSAPAAHERFDRMLRNARWLSFAKQPVIERATGRIVGYSGVDWLEVHGEERLEFGWRLVAPARGLGYATEASRALLGRAAQSFEGELLAIIDPLNRASQRVATKLGFEPANGALLDGEFRDIYRIVIG
jgi:RimJ/RimL family protein N-acetyltransferase